MMKTVGLTGGIGSGKTTVAHWFAEKGIPVYNSDYEAKKLMNEDAELKKELIQIFGSKTYIKGEYNRAYVASKVFNDRESLNKLNAVVHPAVFRHFSDWIKKQDADFIVKEAAILFESGSYKDCDAIISVVADEKIRIDRVVGRDGVSRQKVKDRIKNQWTDEQRIEKSDFVIYNNSDLKELKIEFKRVYKELLKRFASS